MFNLSSQEKTVVLFLAAVFLAGISINYFSKHNPRVQTYLCSLSPQTNGIIDLNTATADEFKSLPGIGDELAQRIIDYRNTAGAFRHREDIKKVKGLGNKKFELFKDKITVKENTR